MFFFLIYAFLLSIAAWLAIVLNKVLSGMTHNTVQAGRKNYDTQSNMNRCSLNLQHFESYIISKEYMLCHSTVTGEMIKWNIILLAVIEQCVYKKGLGQYAPTHMI